MAALAHCAKNPLGLPSPPVTAWMSTGNNSAPVTWFIIHALILVCIATCHTQKNSDSIARMCCQQRCRPVTTICNEGADSGFCGCNMSVAACPLPGQHAETSTQQARPQTLYGGTIHAAGRQSGSDDAIASTPVGSPWVVADGSGVGWIDSSMLVCSTTTPNTQGHSRVFTQSIVTAFACTWVFESRVRTLEVVIN